MKKIALVTGLLLSFNSFSMTENCNIANNIFNDSGMIMVDAMTMAVNDGENLSNTTVPYDDFSIWYKKVYPKKIAAVANKYAEYKTVDSGNPIYLGIASILEVNNFTKALDNYMKDKSKDNLAPINESKDRIEKAYYRLVKDCGKRHGPQ